MIVARQPLTVAEVRKSIRTYADLTDDLLRADWPVFGDRLSVFAHFCRSDAVFSKIHDQLAQNPNVDLNAWLESNGDVRLSGLRFPVDADERISLQFQVVVAGAENPEQLLHRALMWFHRPDSDVSDLVRSLADAIMRPLFRDLAYRLQDIEERLPDDRAKTVSAAALQIFHVDSATLHMNTSQTVTVQNSHGFQIGDANSQTNLDVTLRELVQRIEKAEASNEDKVEAKGRLSRFLEHPLVCSIVGGLTSTAVTAARG